MKLKYSTMRFIQACIFSLIIMLITIFRHYMIIMNRNNLFLILICVCVAYYLLIRPFPQRKEEERSGWNLAIDLIVSISLTLLLHLLFKDYQALDAFTNPVEWWFICSVLMISNLRMGIQALRRDKTKDAK